MIGGYRSIAGDHDASHKSATRPDFMKKGNLARSQIPFEYCDGAEGGTRPMRLRRPTPPPSRLLARLTRSRASRSSSLLARRRARVRVPAEHHETKKERWISPPLPGRFMVPKGGLEPPRVSPPPPQDGVSASSTTSARCRENILSTPPRKINTENRAQLRGRRGCSTEVRHVTFPFPNGSQPCNLLA